MSAVIKFITKPIEQELEHFSLEDIVAYCAKVSNPTNQMNTMTNERLIKYLINNNHWSPFEMVSITMEIKTTRTIARQILRHKSFSFQEFSGRYAEFDLNTFILSETRLQDKKNRQNSIKTNNPKLAKQWERKQKIVLYVVKHAYNWALKNGIAKEQARNVLPEGLTPTTIYMAGTLRSWIHYVKLREANGTQLEHIEIAKQCSDCINQHFPLIRENLV